MQRGPMLSNTWVVILESLFLFVLVIIFFIRLVKTLHK